MNREELSALHAALEEEGGLQENEVLPADTAEPGPAPAHEPWVKKIGTYERSRRPPSKVCATADAIASLAGRGGPEDSANPDRQGPV